MTITAFKLNDLRIKYIELNWFQNWECIISNNIYIITTSLIYIKHNYITFLMPYNIFCNLKMHR